MFSGNRAYGLSRETDTHCGMSSAFLRSGPKTLVKFAEVLSSVPIPWLKKKE